MKRPAPAAVVVVLAGLLLVALLDPSAVRAGVAGPNGSLSELTEFDHRAVESITPDDKRQWRSVTLDGTSIGEIPAPGESAGAFATRIGASSCTELFVDSVVERRLDDTTFDEQSLVTVTLSDDAEVVGTIGEDGQGDFVVVAGAVTILTTITTIETQHITETTTETYDLTCVSPVTPPAEGTLIQETVFDHVVQDDLSLVDKRNLTGVTLDGKPIDFTPLLGESLTDFARRIGAHDCWEKADTSSVPDELTDTTFEIVVDVSVSLSDDAEFIGDPNGDPSSWTVTQGTIVVTTTETTIETRHITRTITGEYGIACTSKDAYPDSPEEPPRDPKPPVQVQDDPLAARTSPAPTGQDAAVYLPVTGAGDTAAAAQMDWLHWLAGAAVAGLLAAGLRRERIPPSRGAMQCITPEEACSLPRSGR